MNLEFLTVGHLSWDLTDTGGTLGGTAAYASMTALRLGLSPSLLTSAGPDLDVLSALPGVNVHSVLSDNSTIFRNCYQDGVRTQTVAAVAGRLTAGDAPQEFRAAPLVLLGPLIGEVGRDMPRAFPGAKIVASLQGWLRRRNENRLVQPVAWDGAGILPFVDAAVVSRDDLQDISAVDGWTGKTPVLIVTEGDAGARMHFQDTWHRIAAFPAREIDPTGAGDVFAAAYLIRYGETSDPLESAHFAACVASFSVEAVGTAGIPTRARVEARLAAAS